MADKYDIPSLATHAASKFKKRLFFCELSTYPDIINVVYSTTPTSCKHLRDILVLDCPSYMNTLCEMQAFVEILHKYVDFAAPLSQRLSAEFFALQSCKREEIMDLDNTIERLKLENANQEKEIAALKIKVARSKKNYRQSDNANQDP